jgi:hypothetical protein
LNMSFTQTGNYGLHDVDEKRSCLSLSSTAWSTSLPGKRRNDDVRRRPPSADYNIVGSYNLQSERRQLFEGQAPRFSSSNIPVFHPDQLQMVSNNMIPQHHLHFPRTMRLHLDLNATPAAK